MQTAPVFFSFLRTKILSRASVTLGSFLRVFTSTSLLTNMEIKDLPIPEVTWPLSQGPERKHTPHLCENQPRNPLVCIVWLIVGSPGNRSWKITQLYQARRMPALELGGDANTNTNLIPWMGTKLLISEIPLLCKGSDFVYYTWVSS